MTLRCQTADYTAQQYDRLTRKLCYRKDDRAMRPIYECLSYVSSQSRTRVKLNSVFATPPLFSPTLREHGEILGIVSPEFPHVSLRVGGWPLGYEERRGWANCPCN